MIVSRSTSVQFSSVQSLSRVWLFVTPWIAAGQASLSITNSRSLLKPMSIESVMPSSHLILCRPLLLLPSVPPSITVFSNESTLCMRWPKYWSFSFSISPSNEYSGLISFRMDWLALFAVQALGPLTCLQMIQFCSFLWLREILLCVCTTSVLLMEIQAASASWLLWLLLRWTLGCMRLLALWFSLGTGNQREPTVQLRELYSMLSTDLNGKEIQNTEGICVHRTPWRRKWPPTPVFLPGTSYGQRSLEGYRPRGHRESDTTWLGGWAHTRCRLRAKNAESLMLSGSPVGDESWGGVGVSGLWTSAPVNAVFSSHQRERDGWSSRHLRQEVHPPWCSQHATHASCRGADDSPVNKAFYPLKDLLCLVCFLSCRHDPWCWEHSTNTGLPLAALSQRV